MTEENDTGAPSPLTNNSIPLGEDHTNTSHTENADEVTTSLFKFSFYSYR